MKFLNFLKINEAAFDNAKFDHSVDLLVKTISKVSGVKLWRWGGENHVEKFKKKSGETGEGVLLFTDSGKMFRLNFSSGGADSDISSIDMFSGPKAMDKPIRSMVLPMDMNIVQVAGMLSTFLGKSVVTEGEDVKTSPGVPEVSTTTQSIKDGTKIAEEVEGKFEDLKSIIEIVLGQSEAKAAVVTGMPGTGKTFIVTNLLKKHLDSSKWVIIKGRSTTYDLYETMVDNANKVIVYDDCDSILKMKDAQDILKAALDSNEPRTVSWRSAYTVDPAELAASNSGRSKEDIEDDVAAGKTSSLSGKRRVLPNHFDFKGKIIFITNLHQNQLDKAVFSRAIPIDITLTKDEMVYRIKSIIKNICPDIPVPIKEEVLSFIKDNLDHIDMRKFIQAVMMKNSGNPRWQHLVKSYVQ